MSNKESAAREYRVIRRKKTRVVNVGSVKVGGDNPIVIQTMTNTPTEDVRATVDQIIRCVDAGAELVRVSVPTVESTAAIPEIVKASPVPIIADVHFHYKRGIEALKGGVSCLRINPGTLRVPSVAKEIVEAAKDSGASIRVGVNAGSLEQHILDKYKSPCPEALVESAMNSIEALENLDFRQIKISVKASDVILMIKSYELLSEKCDYPLHLGVTEAGSMLSSSVKSSLGIGSLLYNGIGDTIRVSVTSEPEEELPVAYEICKSLGLRTRGVTVISCPSCARQCFDVVNTVLQIERRTSHIKTPITVSVLGCVVNGLGEAAHTEIGITGAVSGRHIVYKNGQPFTQFLTEELVDQTVKLIEEMVAEKERAG